MMLLVVDDDPITRMSLRTVLTSEGYSVQTASDGDEALAKLSDLHVDMIIADIYMPGLDGIRMRNKMRESPDTTDTPVLFLSGNDDQYSIDSVQNPQIEAFQKKGRPVKEMLSWIKYLTTPIDKRTQAPHVTDRIMAEKRSNNDRGSRGGTRVPIM